MMKKTALKANLWVSILGILVSGYSTVLSCNKIASAVLLAVFIVVLVVSAMGLSSKEIGEDELDVIHKLSK